MRQLKIAKQIARKDYVSIDVCHQDINALNHLPMKKEIPLFTRIKSGDRKALELLVNDYHRYVVCVAKRFQKNGLTLHELIIKGNFGLVKAAKHFDQTKGYPFISYAVWCIRQSIIKAFVEDVKNKPIPLNKMGIISKGNLLYSKLEQYCEREPEAKDLEGIQEFQAKIMKDALQATSNQMTINCF
jgi:RNA polymerase primary sigma factor